jgi:hypothetical protein
LYGRLTTKPLFIEHGTDAGRPLIRLGDTERTQPELVELLQARFTDPE